MDFRSVPDTICTPHIDTNDDWTHRRTGTGLTPHPREADNQAGGLRSQLLRGRRDLCLLYAADRVTVRLKCELDRDVRDECAKAWLVRHLELAAARMAYEAQC